MAEDKSTLRLAAKVYGNADVLINCPDANTEMKNLILPWLNGYFESSSPDKESIASDQQAQLAQSKVVSNDVCKTIDE